MIDVNNEDYCTLFWDIWDDADISGCCLVHDEYYADFSCTRLEADEALRD